MKDVNDLFVKSNVYKYFKKEIMEDKAIRDTLVAFEEILNIRKNIRSIYNTDDPTIVKSLLGKNVNGITVTQKDYDYVLLIYNTYLNLYDNCKSLLDKR